MLDGCGADYKKRCDARGANFQRSKRLKWLNNRLLDLDVGLELARNEELHDAIEALVTNMEEMKAEKIRLETRTEKQRAAGMPGSKKSAHSAMTRVSVGKRSVMPNKQDARDAECARKREEREQC